MTAIGAKSKGKKFTETTIRQGLQELAALYEHDYGPSKPMPKLLPGKGFADEKEIERFGRLIGVVIKGPVANEVKINRKNSNTESSFGYEFDSKKLEASDFADSQHGKIYAALLEQTKLMMDKGVQTEIAPMIIDMIYALPPGERAAAYAKELAKEGLTFRALLRILRFVICKPSVRSAFAVLLATQAGTPAAAAAAAGLLAVHMPWVALYPPALVTAIVGLITVMGVEGFCDWSGPYLKQFSTTEDLTRSGTGKNG